MGSAGTSRVLKRSLSRKPTVEWVGWSLPRLIGAGVALDAATRGLRTLLLEASDFSAGTSAPGGTSASMKCLGLGLGSLWWEGWEAIGPLHLVSPLSAKLALPQGPHKAHKRELAPKLGVSEQAWE